MIRGDLNGHGLVLHKRMVYSPKCKDTHFCRCRYKAFSDIEIKRKLPWSDMPARRSTRTTSTYFLPCKTKQDLEQPFRSHEVGRERICAGEAQKVIKDQAVCEPEPPARVTQLIPTAKLSYPMSASKNLSSREYPEEDGTDLETQAQLDIEPITETKSTDAIWNPSVETRGGKMCTLPAKLRLFDGRIQEVSTKLEKRDLTTTSTHRISIRRKATTNWSRFFPVEKANAPSCLIFPSLNADCFGLIQERLAHEPFKLLVAVIFLHQTKGSAAVPILLAFLEVFSTPESLSQAQPSNIEPFIRSLGLQNKRAQLLISLAQAWLREPPVKGRRYRCLNYPFRGAGNDVSVNEQPIGEDDCREAWEIAHLPGIGPYALDSWRIFCRDTLRGKPFGSMPTPVATEEDEIIEMNQEWTRVLPTDKELRVYLQWRWCRLGWLWDPVAGGRSKVSREILQSMEAGKIQTWLGFDNPWLMDMGHSLSEEQLLGRYHEKQTGMG